MNRKLFVTLAVFCFILFSFIPFVSAETSQTVFGPKELKTYFFGIHLSRHHFTLNNSNDGLISVVKNSPVKKIKSGFIFFNGKYISLFKFLRGDDISFEYDVSLRKINFLTIYFRGERGASITLEVKTKGDTTAPGITFSANPQSINLGESSTLTWTTTNADNVSIDSGIGNVALNGTVSVSPQQTTTYTLTATGPGGTSTASATVTVINLQPTVSFLVQPASIVLGNSAQLSWTTTNADSVSIDNGIGSVDINGTLSVSPEETTTYTITATGPGGTATSSVTLTVTYPLPTVGFSANPESLLIGTSSTLSWNTTNADTVVIDNGIGPVDLNGSITVSPSETTTYTIMVTGPGGTATSTATISVYGPPTVNLSATPDSIQPDESSTLEWSSTYTNSCIIEPGIGSVPASGSITITPTETTVYTITATGPGGTATSSVTISVIYPQPTATITANPDSIAAGETTTLSWSSTNADTVTIDNGIGSVSSNGSITVSPTETTTYTLTAEGPGGTATTSVTVSVTSSLSISITSPSDGEIIYRPDTMVKGIINNPDGIEIGIIVNGTLAIVCGNQFVANHVPFELGENIITAAATDADGNTGQASIAVVNEATDAYITILTNNEAGISPLETTLWVNGTFSFTDPSLSYTGSGSLEITDGSDENEYNASMIDPGIYYITAEITADNSNTYTDTIAIAVLDKTQVDAVLTAKWSTMKTALVSGDIDTALNYFSDTSKGKYQEIFEALGPRLPEIISAMRDIEMIDVDDKIAKYRIKKEEILQGQSHDITYFIYFSKDLDGIWKIKSY